MATNFVELTCRWRCLWPNWAATCHLGRHAIIVLAVDYERMLEMETCSWSSTTFQMRFYLGVPFLDYRFTLSEFNSNMKTIFGPALNVQNDHSLWDCWFLGEIRFTYSATTDLSWNSPTIKLAQFFGTRCLVGNTFRQIDRTNTLESIFVQALRDEIRLGLDQDAGTYPSMDKIHHHLRWWMHRQLVV